MSRTVFRLPFAFMSERLRINFVLSPAPSITGGPLAILEYANRLIERGHSVSITTYPDVLWPGDNPFPWFDFKGKIYYKKTRNSIVREPSFSPASLSLLQKSDLREFAATFLPQLGIQNLSDVIMCSIDSIPDRLGLDSLLQDFLNCLHLMDTIPDCDLNIATWWVTAFPVCFSGKGKPVFFMQHYEGIFYPLHSGAFLHRLATRLSCELPLFKVANSSWLQRVIYERFGQSVPFSNNAIVVSDFAPQPKSSELDGRIRVVTYSHHLEWKGFPDAIAAMARVFSRYGLRVEWNVFGYRHPTLSADNKYAPYQYHPSLSFKQLANLYATSDIALCPSWCESFPLPPLEAMASGTAVVTTRFGTEDYAFDGVNALVVGSRAVEEMASAICRLIEDGGLRRRLASEGRKTAELFTWDRAVEQREQILLTIHRGEYDCDRFVNTKLGFRDSAGIEFERAPADIAIPTSGLLWRNGALFLVHEGKKFQIVNEALTPLLLRKGLGYIELDLLDFTRVPLGAPLRSPLDLPEKLQLSDGYALAMRSPD
jgi:glycosyltransferase involved in cell wall biosynthesis